MAPRGGRHGHHLAAAQEKHPLSYLMGLLNASKKVKYIHSIVAVRRSDSALLGSVHSYGNAVCASGVRSVHNMI